MSESDAVRDKLFFAGAIVLVVLSFAAWGLYLGKDAIVGSVLQIALGAVGGAFGGYGFAASRQKSRQDRDDDPS